MDRKSITGFLLIALVIILYPWYMSIVSPSIPDENNTDKINDKESEQVELGDNSSISIKPSNDKSSDLKSKQIIIESDLYTIKMLNKNGGSFVEYKLNNYTKHDSTIIDLIDPIENDNLLLKFVSMDGERISLDKNWEILSNQKKVTIGENKEILEFQTFYQGKLIKKIFTFYPNSYKIGLQVVFDDPNIFISRGEFTLAWNGGLTTTEKNYKSDYQEFRGYAYLGDELFGSKLKSGNTNSESQNGNTNWVAIRTKYFIASIIPSMPGLGATIGGKLSGDRPSYSVEIHNPVMNKSQFDLYIGPMDYIRIKSLDVGLENAMSLGWGIFKPIGRLITWTLKTMYSVIPNYGIVVILFAFLIKLLLNPLSIKQFKSQKKMQEIQPRLQEIKRKYKNDTAKLSRAQMQLFKDSGYNPASACLPLFLQMPILIAVFTVFRTTVDFRGAPFFGWISDLSAPDTLFTLAGIPINILPFFMGGTMFLQQKMMSANNSDPQQKTIMYVMNAVFLVLFYSFPSGLNLYYAVFNILSIAQQSYMGVGQLNTATK